MGKGSKRGCVGEAWYGTEKGLADTREHRMSGCPSSKPQLESLSQLVQLEVAADLGSRVLQLHEQGPLALQDVSH